MGKHRKAHESRAASWAAALAALVALVAVGVTGLQHSRAHAVHESESTYTPSTMLAQHPPGAGVTTNAAASNAPLDPSVPSASEALGRSTAPNQPFVEPTQAF